MHVHKSCDHTLESAGEVVFLVKMTFWPNDPSWPQIDIWPHNIGRGLQGDAHE